MALIIEDGSIVENANSYVTVAEAQAYADARGLTVTLTEGQLVQAMDYLEAQRSQYQGVKVDPEQSLQFPRNCVYVDTILLDYTKIPNILKQAQMRLAIEVANGIDLFPSRTSGTFVKREKVGPIDTEYSEAIGSSLAPELLGVEALLTPLFNQNGGFTLTTVRI